MSKPSPFKIIFTMLSVAALLALGACRNHPVDYRMHMSVTGTWQGAQSGALLTIYEDGRFFLENVPGSDAPIRGHIERGFDQLLIHYLSPSASCGDSIGIYKFECDRKTLTFEMVKDDCSVRTAQIDRTWNLKFRTCTTSLK